MECVLVNRCQYHMFHYSGKLPHYSKVTSALNANPYESGKYYKEPQDTLFLTYKRDM